MLIISILIFVFSLICLIVTFSNKRELQKLNKIPLIQSKEKVSICIPARNEEAKIKNCLEGMLSQTYNNTEILVLDDNSTDKTWDIINEMASIYPQIKPIKGKPLKTGWKGKQFAMEQLLEKSSGTYIMFTDADTKHKPNSIAKGVSILKNKNVDLVTGYPKISIKSYWASLVTSNMVFNTAFFLPLFLQSKLKFKGLAMAFGPYMLLKKSSLLKIDGFNQFKDVITDDVALSRTLKKQKFKQIFVDFKEEEECNMYENFSQAFNGISRSIMGVLNPLWFPLLLIAMSLLFISSFSVPISIVLILQQGSFSIESLLLLLGGLILYFSWYTMCRFHGFSKAVSKSQPLAFLMVILLYLFSFLIQVFRVKVYWKNRII